MESIEKEVILNISTEKAFDKFVNEFNEWWPKEYTWSQDTLKEISITSRVGAFCTEIGPNGFRIDWGTVIGFQKDRLLSFKWQIGPERNPVPNPEKASLVTVTFNSMSKSKTVVKLVHAEFENYGDNYPEYLKAMDSKQGWDYLIKCYKGYAEQ